MLASRPEDVIAKISRVRDLAYRVGNFIWNWARYVVHLDLVESIKRLILDDRCRVDDSWRLEPDPT